LNYADLKPLYAAVLEGYTSASRGEFPPRNPHAPCGVEPGREDTNPPAAAWFYGYWAYIYRRHGPCGSWRPGDAKTTEVDDASSYR
jgi:hypothetical protein